MKEEMNMASMIYYEELLYLFVYVCWLFVTLVCLSVSIAVLVWCFKKVKKSIKTETWNGFHGQVTAPKGTFEKIFNDEDNNDYDI